MKKTALIAMCSLGVSLAMLQPGCATRSGGSLSGSSASRLQSEAAAALRELYASTPAAKELGSKARGILVFPDILKGGFMFGGQVGNGVLFQNGRAVGYYNPVAGSYGLQAGLQRFGYALFLMDDAALAHLHASGGWEVGVGPSIVVVDEGMAKSLTTTTLRSDIYAFIFNQIGLMAGAGLQGTKITEIQPWSKSVSILA